MSEYIGNIYNDSNDGGERIGPPCLGGANVCPVVSLTPAGVSLILLTVLETLPFVERILLLVSETLHPAPQRELRKESSL